MHHAHHYILKHSILLLMQNISYYKFKDSFLAGIHDAFMPHQKSYILHVWEVHCAYERRYPSCLLLYINT